MSGMTKTSRDISSTRLFCRGVPVRRSFLRAWTRMRFSYLEKLLSF